MKKLKAIFNRLKEKWGIQSNWDFFIINVVFSLAGMMIVHERRPIFEFFHITKQTPLWFKIIIYIPICFPLYQINLLIFGTLLGKFKFFWKKEKQIIKFILKPFLNLMN
ncbi:MAG: hypothetical protein H6755_06775 [Candidatus Omnitrophica bacterium]|nr:hypothetical protein [Candidatus Omnitrophota bacterium]